MGSAAAGLLLAATIVAALGSVGVWLVLRRPARKLQMRRREEALAAAAHYTPAPRVSPYGAPPVPAPPAQVDPCAPGLSDHERVSAMRTMLLQGASRSAAAAAPAPTVPDLLLRDEGPLTTTPMAWNPTLPPDEADLIDTRRPAGRPRVREADSEHITI